MNDELEEKLDRYIKYTTRALMIALATTLSSACFSWLTQFADMPRFVSSSIATVLFIVAAISFFLVVKFMDKTIDLHKQVDDCDGGNGCRCLEEANE